MSSFNANSLDGCIKLAYRTVSTDVFVDPVAERLARVAMSLAIVSWLIYGGIIVFRPMDWATVLVIVSFCTSIAGLLSAVGAMLERNIPWLAWLAVSCVAVYWIVLAWAAVIRIVAPFGSAPPPFPLT
jgi:hypothetical protein